MSHGNLTSMKFRIWMRSNKMAFSATLFCLSLGFLGACATQGPKSAPHNPYEVKATDEAAILVLFLSDYHSQLRAGKDELGGIATIKSWIDYEKSQVGPKTDVLVVAGGDMFGKGSLPCQMTWDQDCAPLLKPLGIEYSALGNYELYNREGDLKKLVQKSGINYLGANVTSVSGRPLEFFKNGVVTYTGQLSGLKLGLVSWINSADIRRYKLRTNPSERDWNQWSQLSGELPLLFLTHQTLLDDQKFLTEACSRVGKAGVVALLKGNDHTPKRLLEDGCAPLVEPGALGNHGLKLLIRAQQPNSSGEEEMGIPSPYRLNYEFIDLRVRRFEPNAALAAQVQALYQKHAPNADEIMVSNAAAVSKKDLTDWVAEAYRKRTRADVGIANSGYVKNGLEKGEVTREEFLLAMPHKNDLKGMDISVKELEGMLCKASRRVKTAEDHGSDLHFSGIQLVNSGTEKCKIEGTRKSRVKLVVDSYVLSRSSRWLGKDLSRRMFGFGVDSRRVKELHVADKKSLIAD